MILLGILIEMKGFRMKSRIYSNFILLSFIIMATVTFSKYYDYIETAHARILIVLYFDKRELEFLNQTSSCILVFEANK